MSLKPSKEVKTDHYERMLSNLKHTYLVVHCGSDHITDAELMEMIHNTLCEVIGDKEFCIWIIKNAPKRNEIA